MLHPSSVTDSPSQPVPPPRFVSTSPPPIISRGDSGRGGGSYQIPSALSPHYATDSGNTNTGLTTKSLIHRLRHAVSMQEATLRNLREPLSGGGGHGGSAAIRSIGGGAGAAGGGYSTNASSHGAASSGASSSHFHVASRRRWCPEFADTVTNAMIKCTSVEERWAAAQACLDAFGLEAVGVGRSFLERYLGDYANDELVNSERSFRTETPSGLFGEDEAEGVGATHSGQQSVSFVDESNQPAPSRSNAHALSSPVGAAAGLSSDKREFPCEWATATQLSSGSFLTITLLDCEDNAAHTAASKEQQCHMLTLAAQMALMPSVLVFPCPRCIVQWRGRVLLIAASPICTGEPKKVAEHTELAVVMSLLSDSLHLSRYFTPKSLEDTSEEVLVAGHPSASTRLGRDGRWYIEGLSNVFPHFPPARGASISARRHMLHLRPEAVVGSDAPHWLSPAAFLMYGTRDSTSHNANVRERSQTICQHTLQRVAAEITRTYGGEEDEGAWSSTDLVASLHRHGINVGFLGLLLAHVRGAATAFVFSEMLARTARDYLRNSMSRRVEIDDATKVISEFLSEICRPETFTAVWQDELFQRMATKFAAYGSFFSEHATTPPVRWLNVSYLLRRLPSLVGFQFAAGVTAGGTSSFHFPVKALLVTKRAFPLPSPRAAGGLLAHVAFLPGAPPTPPPLWAPVYSKHIQLLQKLSADIIAAVGADGKGGEVAPEAAFVDATIDRSLEVAEDALRSFLQHMQAILPAGSVAPAATADYGTTLLYVATMLRRVATAVAAAARCAPSTRQRGQVVAKAALQHAEMAAKVLHRLHRGGSKYFSSTHAAADAGDLNTSAEGHVTPSALAAVLGFSATSTTPLSLCASAELARCLDATGASLDAMQLLDKTFQSAAAMSSSGAGGGGRRGLSSTAASTPRAANPTGRSATSSVEVQALSLPSGSIQPPPAWLAGGAGAGHQTQFLPQPAAPGGATRSTSAGAAARTKMSVSIIGEEDGNPTGARSDVAGEPLNSCAASATMPDSEARALSRSGHDAISLSDFDNDAISQGPHNFFIARSSGGGFNAIASALASELADLYDTHGCLVEAESVHRYAHHATIAILGDDHPSVSLCLNNLAVNLMSQQKFAEAEDLFRQDLALSERIFGPRHPNVSSTLNNLACLLDQLGRPTESEPLLLRDLDITKATLGAEHPNVATACNNLAATYLRRGMLPEACEMFTTALNVREAAFGASSGPAAEVLFNLGAVLRRQGRNDEAMAQWERCYAILQALPMPPTGPSTTLRLLESMCLLCEETQNYARSEELMEAAFQLKQVDSFVEGR